MKALSQFFNILSVVIVILLQQGLVFAIGLVFYSQSSPFLGIVIWCLAIPMLYLNYNSWKGIMKYGTILFFTANSDTSSIDVKPENNLYREGV